ncbi:MAG: hypothetical protein M0Z55_04215 [Peptococcaceae bacterium]|nr:hypothetical protein [Peptococcaceae bacterium]
MKLKRIGIAILLGFLILVPGAWVAVTKTDAHKYVDISNVVKEAFVTDKGFSDELSKHITKEVFNKTNIYNAYPFNSPEFEKPFKVDFSLREVSQKKENDIIKVDMIYSVMIHDSNNKTVGGSKDIPITFTVQEVGSGWIITNKEEQP